MALKPCPCRDLNLRLRVSLQVSLRTLQVLEMHGKQHGDRREERRSGIAGASPRRHFLGGFWRRDRLQALAYRWLT